MQPIYHAERTCADGSGEGFINAPSPHLFLDASHGLSAWRKCIPRQSLGKNANMEIELTQQLIRMTDSRLDLQRATASKTRELDLRTSHYRLLSAVDEV